jgi:hypothetical protein
MLYALRLLKYTDYSPVFKGWSLDFYSHFRLKMSWLHSSLAFSVRNYVRTFQCRMPFSTLLRRPPRRLRSGRYTPLHFVYRPSHDVYAFYPPTFSLRRTVHFAFIILQFYISQSGDITRRTPFAVCFEHGRWIQERVLPRPSGA